MNARVALLSGVLLAAPAWSQEPVAPSFDLRDTNIRKIVQDAAATQYGESTVAEPVSTPKTARVVTFEPPDTAATRKEPQLPRVTAPRKHEQLGPISALVDAVVDALLETDSIDLSNLQVDDWLRCPPRAESLPEYLRDAACPGRQSAYGLTEVLGHVPSAVRSR